MSEEGNGKLTSGSALFPIIYFVVNLIIIKSGSLEQFELLGLGNQWKFNQFVCWSNFAMFVIIFAVVYLGVLGKRMNYEFETLVGLLTNLYNVFVVVVFIVLYVKIGEFWFEDPEHTIFFYPEFWNQGVADYGSYNGTATVVAATVPNPNGADSPLILDEMHTIAATPWLRYISLGFYQGTELISARDRVLLSKYPSIVPIADTIAKLKNLSRRLTTEETNQLAPRWVYTMSDVIIRLHAFTYMLLPMIVGLTVFCCCCVVFSGGSNSLYSLLRTSESPAEVNDIPRDGFSDIRMESIHVEDADIVRMDSGSAAISFAPAAESSDMVDMASAVTTSVTVGDTDTLGESTAGSTVVSTAVPTAVPTAVLTVVPI